MTTSNDILSLLHFEFPMLVSYCYYCNIEFHYNCSPYE